MSLDLKSLILTLTLMVFLHRFPSIEVPWCNKSCHSVVPCRAAWHGPLLTSGKGVGVEIAPLHV